MFHALSIDGDVFASELTMTSQAGQPGQAVLQAVQQKPDQREASDLAFLDNIEELNTTWPDFQVCAGATPVWQQHGYTFC